MSVLFLSQDRAVRSARLVHIQKASQLVGFCPKNRSCESVSNAEGHGSGAGGSNPSHAPSLKSPCGITELPRGYTTTRGEGGRGLLVSYVGFLRHVTFGCFDIFQIANPATLLKGNYTPDFPALNSHKRSRSCPTLCTGRFRLFRIAVLNRLAGAVPTRRSGSLLGRTK